MEDTYGALARAADPNALKQSLAAHADDLRQAAGAHHVEPMAVVRSASHRGHQIVIRTTYEITVDGEPFEAHVTVRNDGQVHYHGLPTREFASTVDLVKQAIDYFPDDFGQGGGTAPTGGHTHDSDHQHHGGGH